MDFSPVIEHAKNITRLLLQTVDEHAQERWELLQLFGFILLHDRQILRLADCFIDGISCVAEGQGRQLDEMPEDREEMVTVSQLTDRCFQPGKIFCIQFDSPLAC